MDAYDILGVSRNATKDEIKSAFRKKAKQYHPDINKSKDANSKFLEIQSAYNELMHGTVEARQRVVRRNMDFEKRQREGQRSWEISRKKETQCILEWERSVHSKYVAIVAALDVTAVLLYKLGVLNNMSNPLMFLLGGPLLGLNAFLPAILGCLADTCIKLKKVRKEIDTLNNTKVL